MRDHRPKRYRFALAALAGLTAAQGSPTAAQSIVEERGLTFGSLAIPSNITAGTVTVAPDGSVITTGSVISVVRGTPGRYRITGLLAQSQVSLSYMATPMLPDAGPGGPASFTIESVLAPDLVVTDGTGGASIDLGATLATSGDGRPYADGGYRGDILITAISP